MGLVCSQIYPIQESYVKKHVSHFSLSKKLQIKTIEQLVKRLDSGKLYFIQSDIDQIKKWFRTLFRDVKKGNCSALNKLYKLFYQRITERMEFAKNEILKKDFKLDKNIKLILDADKRDFPRSKWPLEAFHKKYIHYELASILSAENDLKKAKKYLLGIYERKLNTIASWDPDPSPERLKYCKEQDKKIKLVKTCKSEKWYALYLDSFARALDPHSSYLSQYELDDFEINMRLSLEGIGASLSSRYGYTVVERLLPGGAAFKSKKIKRKDKIIAIGQNRKKMIPIFGWDLRDVVEMVRGKKGTRVYLKILRTLKNNTQKKFVVSLIRKKIPLQENASSIIYSTRVVNGKERTVGVIRVPSFYGGKSEKGKENRSVSRDVQKILKKAQSEKKLSAIVLDLSGNGGGVLSEAVRIVGLFLKKGNVVRQMTKSSFSRRSIYHTLRDDDNSIEYKGPLVVLVDRSSASASEIVAGALKDYKRAVVVGGDHTFGKGSIQSVENLGRNLGATKTTVGLFYVPSGRSTQKMGIESDISFPSVISIDSFGEKTLDYVLPRQHTTSFLTRINGHSWVKVGRKLIEKLNVKSQLRIKKSDKFKKINTEITKLKEKLKNKNQISIKTFLTDAKKRNEEEKEQEEDLVLDYNDPEFKKKYLERADIFEAVNIAWDMSEISSQLNNFVKKN